MEIRTIDLRPITPEDEGFLWELHLQTMRSSVEPIWGWDEAEQRRLLRTRNQPTERFIIEVNGVAAGHFERILQPDARIIGNIQIHPSFQGIGVGTQLIEQEVEQAHLSGLLVRLGVLVTNPNAKALYLRLGFEETSVTATHHFLERRRQEK